MANLKTMENGEVRKQIKWRTGARNGTNAVWRKKWVIVPATKVKPVKQAPATALAVAKVGKPLKKSA